MHIRYHKMENCGNAGFPINHPYLSTRC
jgi:hypothetical protein